MIQRGLPLTLPPLCLGRALPSGLWGGRPLIRALSDMFEFAICCRSLILALIDTFRSLGLSVLNSTYKFIVVQNGIYIF